jgi:hypothetical protein
MCQGNSKRSRTSCNKLPLARIPLSVTPSRVIYLPCAYPTINYPTAGFPIRLPNQTASDAGWGKPADDVANAVAFLALPEESFITGTDLIVDGGVAAAGLMQPPSAPANVESEIRCNRSKLSLFGGAGIRVKTGYNG